MISIFVKCVSIFFHWLYKPLAKALFYFRFERKKKTPALFKYCGFDVIYKKGDGGVNHISSGYSYEPDVIRIISSYIHSGGVIIDAGSNIGLITLAVLRANPSVTSYCFEPSKYAYESFKHTIRINKLEKNIILSNLGLWNRAQKLTFHTHGINNALGDGIYDTKRAGKSKIINIQTTTLDSYVKKHDIKKVNLVKVDVEGAEKMVLEGSVNTIHQFHPLIVFEANPINLKAYSLQPADIYHFFHEILHYDIYSLDQIKLGKDDFIIRTAKIDNYMGVFNG